MRTREANKHSCILSLFDLYFQVKNLREVVLQLSVHSENTNQRLEVSQLKIVDLIQTLPETDLFIDTFFRNRTQGRSSTSICGWFIQRRDRYYPQCKWITKA